ncbi:M28 family metallopeptidase [Aminobacterium mobile]|jgi:hypothetical protein
MLSSLERDVLANIHEDCLERDVAALSALYRRQSSSGLKESLDWIRCHLDSYGIKTQTHQWVGELTTPISASLRIKKELSSFLVPCKVWGFSGRSRKKASGPLVCVDPRTLPAPEAVPYFAIRKEVERDLEGKIVLTKKFHGTAILALQDRGAAAVIVTWPGGDEEEIHESGTGLIWGNPEPLEETLDIQIPLIAVNYMWGCKLLEVASGNGKAEGEIEVEIQTDFQPFPVLEARLPGEEDNSPFLLVGAHIDAKHWGATDNASGAALALHLARIASTLRERRYGLRICWWTGHEFGHYAGSSAYCLNYYADLEERGLAYLNIDMPGVRGASHWQQVACSPDLTPTVENILHDVVGRSSGVISDPVRAWDQSFQNLGLSSLLVWASSLPEGSPYRSGSFSMPRWWHTESDVLDCLDHHVYLTDAHIYTLALIRSVCREGLQYDVHNLWMFFLNRLEALCSALKGRINLENILSRAQSLHQRSEAFTGTCPWSRDVVWKVRRLNRLLFAQKAPWSQDWCAPQEAIPGLSAGISMCREGRGGVVLDHWLMCQRNRIYSLLGEIEEGIR